MNGGIDRVDLIRDHLIWIGKIFNERTIMDYNENSHSQKKITVRIDPDFKEIVPGFLEHRRGDIKKILDALERNDFEGIRVIGHTLKGVGGGYGFDAVSDSGRLIEAAAIDHNPEDIRRCIEELSSYIDNVVIVYE